MANTKSALKRIRSAERRRLRNRSARTQARSYVKRARAEIAAGNLDDARKTVVLAVRALDKAAAKGIIHKNNASRRKSRLMQRLNKAASQVSS